MPHKLPRPVLDLGANIRSFPSEARPTPAFRRALDSGNLALIRGAARELPQVGLDDDHHAAAAGEVGVTTTLRRLTR